MDPGRRLGHYAIQATLGEGGMGTVYQALDTRLNRLVALKVLSPDQWEGTTGRGRLMREAQAASALNHPNIVTVYEIGHEAGVDFIAMECIEGKTLGSASRRHRCATPWLSPSRLPTPSPPRTPPASCIAISNPPTSWSPNADS